jgi:predicted DNA-binding transcriptional regulator AlpA
MSSSPRVLIKQPDAIKRYGVSRSKLWRLQRDNKLTDFRPLEKRTRGNPVLYDVAELEAALGAAIAE